MSDAPRRRAAEGPAGVHKFHGGVMVRLLRAVSEDGIADAESGQTRTRLQTPAHSRADRLRTGSDSTYDRGRRVAGLAQGIPIDGLGDRSRYQRGIRNAGILQKARLAEDRIIMERR